MFYKAQGVLRRLPPTWQARVIKVFFNWMPSFRGTGGRVVSLSPDLLHLTLKLPFNWRTRNVVGSIFGGSISAVTDGGHATMLIMALGPNFVIWDKSVTIEFRRPATRTLYAQINITNDELNTIRQQVAQLGEVTRDYENNLYDAAGTLHSIVRRTVYIANKAHYRQKQNAKKQVTP